MTERTAGGTDRDGQPPGQVVVAVNLAGTAAFTVTAIAAAVFFTTALQWIGAITAMVLFAVGVVTFLWSYYNAVQRSRYEQISVLQVYLLTGDTAPPWVRWRMWMAMAVQVSVALSTAIARPNGPDGRPGSSLAVGILVPMLGFGLNGLWAAFHGRFDRRAELRPSNRATAGDGAHERAGDGEMPADDDSFDKNAGHG